MVSFRVRDRLAGVRFRKARPPAEESSAEDLEQEAVHDAFIESAAYFRKKNRRIYRLVDKVLANPKRGRQKKKVQPFDYGGPVGECLRCGNEFPKLRETDEFCRAKCREEHKVWLKSRGRRTVKP